MLGFRHQILVYCEQITHRLQYVLEWVFLEQLAIEFKVTYDREEWLAFEGMKINYSEARIEPEDILIRPHRLIYESGESPQQLNINRWKQSTVLFYNQPGALVPFDLFSAIFYLISRYEEYLPYKKDAHGRYPASASVAAQFKFLQQPVIDEWILAFKQILEKKFRVILPQKRFVFQPSYDIDIAWAYLNKPRKQNWAGAFRDLTRFRFDWVLDRIIVTNSGRPDPYDGFKWMEDLQAYYQLQPIYFFLVGANGTYDRNILPTNPAMQTLIRHTSNHAQIGLHPSYASFKKEQVMEKEAEVLEQIIDKPITKSRQHYLRMRLPDTYSDLISIGIEDEYSMGYSTVNGFRAGTSHSFLWYDLASETKTKLRVHPFCFMETTAINAFDGDKAAAFDEVERLIFAVKKVNGRFLSIYHNNNLGSGRENKAWYKFYQKMIELIKA